MNSDKLKNIIYKKAHGNSDISQKFYQLFYFERILERISISNYRGQIILKGGLLLTSIIGNDERTTKDMDATLKGIPLTKNDVEKVFNEILHIDIDDGVSFQIISIKDIRLEDEYGGFRLNILSKLDKNCYSRELISKSDKSPHPKTQIVTLKAVKELFDFMEDIEYKIH